MLNQMQESDLLLTLADIATLHLHTYVRKLHVHAL